MAADGAAAQRRGEGAAHDHHIGQPQEQAQFAQRIGQVDVGLVADRLALAAPGEAVAVVVQGFGDGVGPFRVARHDDQEQAVGQMIQRADDGHFLMLMGAGGDDDGAVVDQGRQAGELALVIGQGLAGQLQIHLTVDAGAQGRQPVGAVLILRPDVLEPVHQGAGHARGLLPPLGRLVGDAGADQGQRHAALAGGGQEVGPQLALDKDADIGPPVVEEGRDRRGGVHRGELMDYAARQARRQHLGRGQGAGSDQHRHIGPVLADALG